MSCIMSTHNSMTTHSRWTMVLVLILVSATAQMVSADDGKVTWYWKDVGVTFSHPTGLNYEFHKLMDKDEPTGTTDYTVSLSKGESAWWYAHEPAECDLTFPAGNWKVIYWAEASGDSGHRVYARLYVVHTDGTFTEIVEGYSNLGPSGTPVQKTRTLQSSSIDVNTGERIAVQIEWSSSADPGDVLTIHYNHPDYKSHLVSPPHSPVWPVPEPATIILVSAGLLILAGYAYMGKRSK